jgi:FkbM family methyltransferase
VTPQRRPLKKRAGAAARLLVNRAGLEVTRDRFKHRFLHSLAKQGITDLLDIGANAGQFGHLMRRGGFDGRIVSVEPLSEAYARLQIRARSDAKWAVEQAAVSSAPGMLTVNVSANSVSSSVLPILRRSTDAAAATAYVGAEEVVATTVDDLVARHGLAPETTLLKIDVQGFEMSVLEGAALTLDRFGALRTEMTLVPLYDGQSLLPEMIEYLGDHGFDLWYVDPGWVEPDTKRMLQLDGVFFRKP